MPDLETLLRDVRPVPAPEFAARLDAQVAAGFRRPKRRFWRVSFLSVRQQLLAMGGVGLVAGLAAILVVANLSYTTSSSDTMSVPAVGKAESDTASGAGAAVPLSALDATAAAPDARAVLKNASITLTTTAGEVQGLSDRAIRVADTLGGYVASSSVDTAGSHATATLELKVPSAKLDAALAQLSKLGHVSSRSQQTQDMTDQRAVLEAAVRDARADRAGLRSRLAKATTDGQRDRLRAQLSRASRRVTNAERRVAQLNGAVAYATIDLTIRGKRDSGAAPVPGDRWTPADALKDAGRVLEVIAGVLVIGLAVLLPVAVLAALAAYGNRGLTRRRRRRALEAS